MRYFPVATEEDVGLGLLPSHEVSFGRGGFQPGSLWQIASGKGEATPATTWVGIGLVILGLVLIAKGKGCA